MRYPASTDSVPQDQLKDSQEQLALSELSPKAEDRARCAEATCHLQQKESDRQQREMNLLMTQLKVQKQHLELDLIFQSFQLSAKGEMTDLEQLLRQLISVFVGGAQQSAQKKAAGGNLPAPRNTQQLTGHGPKQSHGNPSHDTFYEDVGTTYLHI